MPKTQKARKRTRPKVFLIDVNGKRINQLAELLNNEGFNTVTCQAPRGALARLRQELPDAVVIEVILSSVSGFEIAARMQADRRLSNIPVFFTSDIQDSDGVNNDYFSRPLKRRKFICSLRKRIGMES